MKINKSERGQSLVELAISLVVLLYLLSGVVEFGIAFFQFIQLRDAAQEGALYGSINPYLDSNNNSAYDSGEPVNQAGVEARVRGASSSPIDLSDSSKVTVEVIATDEPCVSNAITVNVSFTHQIFMPFIPTLIGSSTIPLTGSVTDTILNPVCP